MEQRRALAAKCSTNPDYLWQVANGWRGRKAGIDLCKRIEEATEGQVTRYDLRPDVFGQPAKPAPEHRKAG